MCEADELAMALAMSMETVLPLAAEVESGVHGGVDTSADGSGAAGGVGGSGPVGGGGVTGETEPNSDLVTTVLQDFLSQLVLHGDLDAEYTARLLQDTTLRAITGSVLGDLDGEYDFKGAVFEAVNAIRQEEEEEEMDRDMDEW